MALIRVMKEAHEKLKLNYPWQQDNSCKNNDISTTLGHSLVLFPDT